MRLPSPPSHIFTREKLMVPPSLSGLRVVVVDDQEDCRFLVTCILESYGATVKPCESANEALSAIVQYHPDVIVSDILMPEHDGYWLIEKVRQLEPGGGGKTPAIALTARTSDEERRRALDSGFQMHIRKPFEADQVVEAVAILATGENA